MYPEDSVQSIVTPTDWWVRDENNEPCRGALILAFVSHVDQVPYTFEPLGRKEPDRHDSAEIRVAPLRINRPRRQTDLPVAAMPLHAGEVWAAYRAKKRPCLIIGSGGPSVDRGLTRGKAKYLTAPTVLAAPYYGATQDGKRGGYHPEFVERIRHCEYPQFLWDRLPIRGPEESILRLDQLQSIGAHYNSYESTGFRLGSDALEIVDELFQWLIWGGVPEDGLIMMYRKEIESMFDV